MYLSRVPIIKNHQVRIKYIAATLAVLILLPASCAYDYVAWSKYMVIQADDISCVEAIMKEDQRISKTSIEQNRLNATIAFGEISGIRKSASVRIEWREKRKGTLLVTNVYSLGGCETCHKLEVDKFRLEVNKEIIEKCSAGPYLPYRGRSNWSGDGRLR